MRCSAAPATSAGLSELSGLGGGDLSGALGGDPAVAEMIRSVLGGQLSEDELAGLLSGMGGAGGGGFGLPPELSGNGLDISDLDGMRDEINRRIEERGGGGSNSRDNNLRDARDRSGGRGRGG